MGTVFLYGTGGVGSGGILTVTAPPNVTVTVSKDGKTKTKISDNNGVVVFKGLATGTWMLTITNGVQTAVKPVEITANYSTVIAFFSATINITYPVGSTCTCSDGVTTLTAPNTSGSWACVVPNAGTWTVYCTDGSDSDSESANITTDGQSSSVKLSYWNGELYQYGNLYEDHTGGLSMVGVKRNNSYGEPKNPNVTYNSDNLYIAAASSGTGGIAYFTKKIDLTGYTKLHFKGTMKQGTSDTPTDVMIGVWSSFETTVYDNLKASVNGSSTAERVIDISGLSGSYYVGFWVFWHPSGNSTITVNEVWMT